MARVPTPTPRVAPVADQSRYQQATPIDTSAISRGLGDVGQALSGLAQQEHAKRERELAEEKQFQRVRTSQGAFTNASNGHNDTWAKISQTTGANAENAVALLDADAEARRAEILKIPDLGAQAAAMGQFNAVAAALRARAQGHAIKGRQESIQKQHADLVGAAAKLVGDIPDSPVPWQQAAEASAFRMQALSKMGVDVSDTMRKEDLKSTNKMLTSAVIDRFLADGSVEGADQAMKWLQAKKRPIGNDDKRAMVEAINRERDNRVARQKREQVDTDAKGWASFYKAGLGEGGETQQLTDIHSGKALEGLSPQAQQSMLQYGLGISARLDAEEQARTDNTISLQIADNLEAGHPVTVQYLLDQGASPALIQRYASNAIAEARKGAADEKTAKAFERAATGVRNNGGSWLTTENLTAAGIPADLQARLMSVELTKVLGEDEKAQAVIDAGFRRQAQQETFSALYNRVTTLKRGEFLPAEEAHALGSLPPALKSLVDRRLKIHQESLEPGAAQYKATLDGLVGEGGRLFNLINVATEKDDKPFRADKKENAEQRAILNGLILDRIENYMQSLPEDQQTPMKLMEFIDQDEGIRSRLTTLSGKQLETTLRADTAGRTNQVKPPRTRDTAYGASPAAPAVANDLSGNRPLTDTDKQDIIDEF